MYINFICSHFIGDYLLQNDWMAANKKRHYLPCLVHVLCYLIPFLFCSLTATQLILIGVQHYIQDRTNLIFNFMVWKGSKNFACGPCAPWSIILTDNIIHILFILFVVKFD